MTYVRRRPKCFVIQDRIHYRCELDTCPACGTRLVTCRHYRWAKPVQQLDRVVYVTNRPKRCPNPDCAAATYGSVTAQTIALPNNSYGLDVIAQLGWWRDHEHLSGAQLHARLHGHALQVDLRRDVRQAIRPSLRQLASTADSGFFPPAVVSGLVAPPVAAEVAPTTATVIHRYAQVLQLSLGRGRRSSFDWAGVQLYAEVQALAAALDRAQAVAPHPL